MRRRSHVAVLALLVALPVHAAEYQAPVVYMEEHAATSKPIPGVDAVTTGAGGAKDGRRLENSPPSTATPGVQQPSSPGAGRVSVSPGVTVDNRGQIINPPAAGSKAPIARSPGHAANTNRAGGDYRDFAAADAHACQTACTGEAACKAWTWVRGANVAGQGRCWLKNQVPPPRRDVCCISGVK